MNSSRAHPAPPRPDDDANQSDLSSDMRWWLAEETTCIHCWQGYAEGVGIHCVMCARESCSFCVLATDDGEQWICSACHSEMQAEAGA